MSIPVLQLKKGKERSINNRHPWIFSGAVAKLPDCEEGTIVMVTDFEHKKLCYGFLSHKSQIVYCKHGKRLEEYKNITFTFLGFTFGLRVAKNKNGEQYLNFSAGVSSDAMKSMKQQARRWKLSLRNEWDIDKMARIINPIIRRWYQYYGKWI